MSKFLSTQPEYYGSLEDLRKDKLRLSRQIRKSAQSIREGAKQYLMPESRYANSSNKYLRFVGYGFTAWKAARTVNKIVKLVKSFRNK